jgi:hypothetical protein
MAGHCGSCTACCRVLSIKQLNKPAGKWCEHCAVGQGCTVYERRPEQCSDYECLWLHSQHDGFGSPMPDEMRPDRCKVVFHPIDEGLYVALCMPGSPDAWRRGAAKRVIDWLVGNGERVLAGLPGTPTRTLIDRDGEREMEVGAPDADGNQRIRAAINISNAEIIERGRAMAKIGMGMPPESRAGDAAAYVGFVSLLVRRGRARIGYQPPLDPRYFEIAQAMGATVESDDPGYGLCNNGKAPAMIVFTLDGPMP